MWFITLTLRNGNEQEKQTRSLKRIEDYNFEMPPQMIGIPRDLFEDQIFYELQESSKHHFHIISSLIVDEMSFKDLN